jgi:transposase
VARPPRPDLKQQSLRDQGVLHRRAEAVTDELFRQLDFFDPRDLLQVKYEMLRRVETEGYSVSAAAAAFGLSRPSYYEARAAWEQKGVAGLLPKKRGPRGAHTHTAVGVRFLRGAPASDTTLRAIALTAPVAVRFGVHGHPRSIDRDRRRV